MVSFNNLTVKITYLTVFVDGIAPIYPSFIIKYLN